MTARQWKNKIKKACEDAGTYRTYYDHVIDTLAAIMETRDRAQEQYIKLGAKPVVGHTNKNGSTNLVKNPTLVVALDCNAQALAYWRDLGLTPAGFKKLNGTTPAAGNAFEGLLGGIEL